MKNVTIEVMLQRRFKSYIRSLSPDLIDRLQRFFGKVDKTYAQEYETLDEILTIIGKPKSFKFVDIGAGDGYNMSIAHPLSVYHKAVGLLVEPNHKLINRAVKLYKSNNSFKFHSGEVTPINVIETLSLYNFSSPLYLKIDIDSYDLDLLREILRGGIRPNVISIEINELFRPPITFEAKYHISKNYITPLIGCSLQSAADVLATYGFVLFRLAFNNAFFVKLDLIDGKFENLIMDTVSAYKSGFLEKDWPKYFPWHKKDNYLLFQYPEESISYVKQHPLFDPEFMIIAQ